MLRKTFLFLIVSVWLLTMGLLFLRHHGAGPGSSAAVTSPHLGERWMGVYYKGGKIGHARRDFRRTESGYALSESLVMNLTLFGTAKRFEMMTSGLLGPDMKVVSFTADLQSDVPVHVAGRVEGKNVKLAITFGDRTFDQVIPVPERGLGLSTTPALSPDQLRPGNTFRFAIFDPSTFSMKDMTMEVAGKGKVTALGAERDAYEIRGSLGGADITVWVAEDGEVLQEESPMGFTLRAETKETAQSEGSASGDLIERAAVPFAKKLPNESAYLKVRIQGIPLRGFDLDGGRQRLAGDVLEITREDLTRLAQTTTQERQHDIFLRESLFIQSNDAAIAGMAKRIAGGTKDRLRAARAIHDWVFRTIEKVPAATIPSAVEVLKSRKGDCNEHAALYTALARAAGVPAKVALGLVHQNGKFYYHAWSEVFIGQWVAVDPTFGQFPADASHIRFVAGEMESQMRMAAVIGRVRIEGLECR